MATEADEVEALLADEILPADPEQDELSLVLLGEVEDDPARWERLEGEPDRAYARFQRYITEGETRSLRDFALAEAALDPRRTPQETNALIRALARRWDWEKRAAAYDEYLAGKALAEYRAERLAIRQRRRQALRMYLNRVVQQMQALGDRPGVQMDYGQLTQAMKMLMPELRAEYDDRPEDRLLDKARDGGAILAVEVQRMLLRIEETYGDG